MEGLWNVERFTSLDSGRPPDVRLLRANGM